MDNSKVKKNTVNKVKNKIEEENISFDHITPHIANSYRMIKHRSQKKKRILNKRKNRK